MDAANSQLTTLLELDARHDDLLHQLAELDQRVSQVLAEYRSGDLPEETTCQPSRVREMHQ